MRNEEKIENKKDHSTEACEIKTSVSNKSDFPILNQEINGKKLVYLDNSATSQKAKSVIKAMNDYYENDNSNVHRSVHELASRSTIAYEKAHEAVARFINCKSEEIIFTRGTTDSINKLANSFRRSKIFKEGDEIVLSIMEHHSNIIAWQELAKELNLKIRWLGINGDFRIDLSTLKSVVNGNTKMLGISHCSNVLGSINPIKKMVEIVKSVNPSIIVVVDGAQSVGHIPIDVKELDCDFLAFSAHKMLGPTGIGALYGKKEWLEKIEPFNYGGSMISKVSKEKSSWADGSSKFEAGTPSIAEAVGLMAAVEYLEKIGMENVRIQMDELCKYGLEKLKEVEGLKIIGPKGFEDRAPIFSFVIKGLHPHDIGEILNREGIAIRGGNHCAMPLFEEIGTNGASRASAYIYNCKEDIDKLILGIKKAKSIFGD